MSTPTAECKTEIAQKHVDINEAILGIGAVEVQASCLLNRVNGNDDCPKDGAELPIPSLSGLLGNGAEEIRTRCQRIREILVSLEEALF